MKKIFAIMLSMLLTGAVSGSAFAQAAMPSGTSSQGRQFGEFQGQPVIGVNELIGKQAVSANGKQLGTIQNVLISHNGREAYIMLSGQRLGKSGQFIPVPWVMAHPSISDGNVLLQLTEQTLRQAPGISSSQTSRLGQMLPEINSYYGGFRGGMGMTRPGYGPGGRGCGYGPGCCCGPCPQGGYGPGYGTGSGGMGSPPGMGYGPGSGCYPYGGMGYGADNY